MPGAGAPGRRVPHPRAPRPGAAAKHPAGAAAGLRRLPPTAAFRGIHRRQRNGRARPPRPGAASLSTGRLPARRSQGRPRSGRTAAAGEGTQGGGTGRSAEIRAPESAQGLQGRARVGRITFQVIRRLTMVIGRFETDLGASDGSGVTAYNRERLYALRSRMRLDQRSRRQLGAAPLEGYRAQILVDFRLLPQLGEAALDARMLGLRR